MTRIVLVEADPSWPQRYAEAERELRAALGGAALRVEHIGSTAVPGLAAKPVVDVQVSVSALEPSAPLVAAVAALGYHWHDDCPDARKLLFSRAEPFRVNLHVRVAGEFSEQAALLFRDHLRANAGARRRYEATKRALAEREWPSVDDYADAKGDIVWALLREADVWSWRAPAAARGIVGGVHVVVLSDTHIRRGGARRLPPAVHDAVARADAILHAGDVVVAEVLEDLARHAPVHAVLGNNDPELAGTLPETLELDLAGLAVAMIHDSGARRGRARRLRRRFPGAGLVVFGHSHEPVNEPGEGGQWLLNPGSPTQRRRQPRHTFATFDVVDGRLAEPRIVPVEARA